MPGSFLWLEGKITNCNVGGGNRTHDLGFRRASLYPLSYTDMLPTLYYVMSIRMRLFRLLL